MIAGIEPFYQRIADAMASAAPERRWASAEFHARFYDQGHSTYEAEYLRPDGTPIGLTPTDDGDQAVRELRQLFRRAGQPLWGEVWFTLRPDGTFNVRWGHDGCNADGDLIWDESEADRHFEARHVRLTAGCPPRPDPLSSAP